MASNTPQPPQPAPQPTVATAQPKQHWKEAWITRSEAISDVGEVAKTYAGRFAGWILFGCMVIQLVGMIMSLPKELTNTVLIIQVITLDVAGFSLSSMADHARAVGNEEAANNAKIMGYILIGMMIITLVISAMGSVYSDVAWVPGFVKNAEPPLVLARIAMVVIYGKVVDGLRKRDGSQVPVQIQDRLDLAFAELVRGFGQKLEEVQSNLQEQVHKLVQEEVQKVQGFTVQEVQRFTTELREEVQGFTATQGSLRTEVQEVIEQRVHGFIAEQVQEGFTTVQGSLHAEVQGVHEQVKLMVQSVSSQRQEVHVGVHTEQVQMSIEQLLNGFKDMQTELGSLRTLVTEVQGSGVRSSVPMIAERSVVNTEPRQGSGVRRFKGSKGSGVQTEQRVQGSGSVAKGSKVQSQRVQVLEVQEVQPEPVEVNPEGSEDMRSKVHNFILQVQGSEERTPTLKEIVTATGCGKSTASTYRSELLETVTNI